MDISSLYSSILNSQSSDNGSLDLSGLDVDSLVSSIQMSFWDTYMNILNGEDDEDDTQYSFLGSNIYSGISMLDSGLNSSSLLSSLGLGSSDSNNDYSSLFGLSGLSGLGGLSSLFGSDDNSSGFSSLTNLSSLSSLLGLTNIGSLDLSSLGLNNFDSYYDAVNIQINQFEAEIEAGGMASTQTADLPAWQWRLKPRVLIRACLTETWLT